MRKTKKSVRKVFKVLSKILLVIFFYLCGLIALTYYQTYQVKQASIQLSDLRLVAEREERKTGESDWSKGMLEVNPDYKGWLTVYGTQVDGPVVFSGDDSWYLRRNFYGESALCGTLFLDGDTDFDLDGNLIVYGHKMKDDTMFGSLDMFKDRSFFKENGIVRWEDINGAHYYKIFALMVLPGSSEQAEYIDIQQWNNVLSAEEAREMLETIQLRASIFQESRFTQDDRYLFLVTCDYSQTDGRLILVGKRL